MAIVRCIGIIVLALISAARLHAQTDPLVQVGQLPVDGGVVSVVRNGVSLDTVIAVVCSWQRNRSIMWAIIAALLSWIYVIYFAITRQPDETRGGS